MKRAITLIMAVIIAAFGSAGALATTSYFEAGSGYDFHDSTLYEDVYGSNYNYGGQNVTDIVDTSLLPGIIAPTPGTASAGSGGAGYVQPSYEYPSVFYPEGSFTTSTVSNYTAFTPASDVLRADGSIGTLSIPSLDISMKAYDGTGSQSMNKGVGHFTDTSAWNGNIGLCGHNRYAAYTIGSIKDLKLGDTIKYTTVYGTRTYAVSFVGAISSTDWSYLGATADNRITLITCLADQPSLRVCVQAIEV